MPQQTINIGSAPDDGTGDTLRVGGDKINDNFTELYADKADKAGATFTGDVIVPDEAYDATAWNGSLEVPTKNAVRDKIESLGSGITELDDIPDVNAPTPANGDVLTWDSTPGEWVPAAPTGGSNALDDLTDVDAPTPSDGDVLTFDSGSGDWVPAAPTGGGGDMEFITRQTVTTLSAVDIALPDAYDSFRIEFYFIPSTDGIGLNAAVSDDNFSSVEAGATDYHYSRLSHAATSTGVVSSNGTTIISIVATASIGNDTSEYSAGTIEVINAKETAPTHIRADFNYVTAAAAMGGARTIAGFKPTQSINGLRITPTAGALTGFYKVWGRSV